MSNAFSGLVIGAAGFEFLDLGIQIGGAPPILVGAIAGAVVGHMIPKTHTKQLSVLDALSHGATGYLLAPYLGLSPVGGFLGGLTLGPLVYQSLMRNYRLIKRTA